MEDEGRASGPADFAKLLRHHRLAAGLSQESLAERARMSSDGISALERGHRRTPQRETLALLAGALALNDEQRRELESAARAGPRGGRGATSLASAQTAASSLPLSLTSFVGRDVELAEVVALVREHRLVTLTGAGGIGKTQMALQAATALSGGAEDIRFIALAPLGSPSPVAPAVAAALGVQEFPNRPSLETLLAHLKKRSMLLILDNCEHVIDEAAMVAEELLAGCPRVRILATSREPLRIAGERTYRLPSLRLPSPDVAAGLSATDAAGYGAIALFSDRARAVDYRFALTGENIPLVAELCRHLDGIPLAIELAAARVNVLSVQALNEMLDDRFRILTAGERVALPRQQTMRGAIDWSYDLLSAPEQRAFERLSIFPGGCTLRAASVVCGEKATEDDLLDRLSSLVDKSLVTTDFEGSEPRYRLLESFRQYALEKLAMRGEREAVSRLQALASLQLAETLDREYDPRPNDIRPQTSAIMIEPRAYDVEPELENARGAIAWALSAGEVSMASRITCGFARIWRVHRGDGEPRRWLDAVVPRLDEAAEPGVAAQAWRTLSSLRFGIQKVEAAERALALATKCDDAFERVASLYQISVGLLHAGRAQEAEAANDLALQICREGGPKWSRRYATALALRATIAQRGGRVDEARQFYTEALSLTMALGNSLEATALRGDLAELEFRAGNPARALEFAQAVAAAARQVRAKRVEISARENAAAYQLVLGDIDGARLSAREALELARGAHPMDTAIAIQHLATVAGLRGDAGRAARLRGYVDAWYSNEGCERDLTERRTYEILMTALHERLAGAEIEALSAEGAQLSEEQAVLEAFAVTC